MNNMIKILQEDDCAPDARKYFAKDFDAETGGNFHELMKHQCTREENACLHWDLTMPNGSYTLTICADDPFFTLYKEQDK